MECPPTFLVTLNRLTGLTSIEDAGAVINPSPDPEPGRPPERRAAPGPHRLDVAGCAAAWFAAPRAVGPVPWTDDAEPVERDLDGREPHHGGVLVIDVDTRFYAVSFDEGFRRVRDEARDQRFGLRVALRCLDTDDLGDLIQGRPGTGRLERTLLTDGPSVLWIRPGNVSEIVRRIGGHALPMPVLSAADRRARLYGASGLRLQLGRQAADLVDDLRAVAAVHDRPVPLDELAFVDHIAPVGDPKTRHQLDAEVETLFRTSNNNETDERDDASRLALMVPDAALPYLDRAVSYRIQIASVSSDVTDLTLADLTGPARRQPPGAQLSALRTGDVSICDLPGGRRAVNRTAAMKWIEAGVRLGDRRFALLDGVWHEFDPDFADRVRHQVADLLQHSTPTALPGWPTGWDEQQYGRHVQSTAPGHLLLPDPELGDLLGPDDELIQLIRANGSADLSHRFAQGLASWQRLDAQAETRQGFRRSVQDADAGRRLPEDFRPSRVVFAVRLAPGHRLDPETLFPFARAALVQAAGELRRRRVPVDVVGIESISAAKEQASENAA